MADKRQSIPKSVRFEVFKRDSFKCQYCGASAPDVLLQIDHIKPVAKGGTNDITNLITACPSCNSGKSDKELDDDSAIQKSRAQLEQLQERREQLDLMMQWMEGLRDLKEEAVDKVCEYWHGLAPGFVVNDNGKKKIRRWLRQYGLEEVLRAMYIAAEQYLKLEDENEVTDDSWKVAFSKIAGICRVNRASKDDPDLRDLYYIRGILRNRIQYYFNDFGALEWLKAARSWGVPLEQLRSIAKSVTTWTQFRDGTCEAIDYQKSISPESNDDEDDDDED